MEEDYGIEEARGRGLGFRLLRLLRLLRSIDWLRELVWIRGLESFSLFSLRFFFFIVAEELIGDGEMLRDWFDYSCYS